MWGIEPRTSHTASGFLYHCASNDNPVLQYTFTFVTWMLVTYVRRLTSSPAPPAPAMTLLGRASTWISFKQRFAVNLKQALEARMLHTPAQWKTASDLKGGCCAVDTRQSRSQTYWASTK
jgi:hypothetical protein